MEYCKDLPGFEKGSYGQIEKDILAGYYQYDEVDHVLRDPEGWRTQIFEDGRFMPIGSES
jgi:hypothetical protein